MADLGGAGKFAVLTDQERQVAEAVARGRRNREVAAELHLSARTVEAHLGRIYRKLGIASRSQLAALARSGSDSGSSSDIPETRYTRGGEVSLAYQVVGDGPRDIVLVPGLASHIEVLWEQPQWRRFVRRISTLGRFIVFDKRGTGLSDPMVPGVTPTLEQRMNDVTAVMDAAGSRKALLVGISEGGPMSLYFAASHPDRVAALMLYGTTLPVAPQERWTDEMLDNVLPHHGTGAIAAPLWPSMARTEEGMRWLGRFERYCVSPAMLRAIFDSAFFLDPNWVAPAVRVPTTVVHGRQDPAIPFSMGEEIMRYLPHGRFVPIDVVDHVPWGEIDLEAVVTELQSLMDTADWSDERRTVLAAVLAVTGVTDEDRANVTHWITTMGGTVGQVADGALTATFSGPSTAVQCAAMLPGLGGGLGVGVAVGEVRLSNGRIEGTVVDEALYLAASAPGETVASSALRHVAAGSVDFVERPDGTFRALALTPA
ncbi:MAG TPA: alpha/beta fold hydrolase [Acidimicrobiales bacterium]|nr:alpha/beta fold hydrolase [Acidimicrobiales bacterium]